MRAFTPSYTVAARLQPDAGVMRATCERHATKLQQMAQIGSIVRLRPIGVLSWSMTSKLGEPTFSQAADARRRDHRSGLARAAKQPFREAAW